MAAAGRDRTQPDRALVSRFGSFADLGLDFSGFEGGQAEPLDAGEDVIGGFGPDEGLGVDIDGLDVGGDGRFEVSRRTMDAAADLLFGEIGEEALDLVDPGG